jgi:hypothetical protein
MLYFVCGKGANKLSRRVFGKVEYGSLHHGPAQFAMQFSKSILIMYIDARGVEGTDEMGGCGGDFAAEGFELARLLWLLVGGIAGV